MIDFIPEILRELNIISMTIRIVLAVLVGGLIGIGRGRQGRAAGLRTHILVCLGSAMTIMVGVWGVHEMGYSSDPLRIGAQVVSGIGFLGAGTIILKGKYQILGLTTAAGLWATAAIGLSIGIGFYEGAVLCTVAVIITVGVMSKLETRINKKYKKLMIYAEIEKGSDIKKIIQIFKNNYHALNVQITSPRSALEGHVGIEATLSVKHNENTDDIINNISDIDNISFAIESI